MAFGLSWFSRGSDKGKNRENAAQKILCDAVARKLCITASYNNGPIHLMEPYVVFRQAETGPLTLAAKMHGHMSHDNLETLEVAKLSLLELTEQSFTPDPRLVQNDHAKTAGVVCAVDG